MQINKEKLESLIATLQTINEETIDGSTNGEAGAYGVATSDEIIDFTTLYQQKATPSIARSMLSNSSLSGPTGALFNLRAKTDGSDAIELLRTDVEVYSSEPIKTNITQEALQDILAMYGQQGLEAVATLLQGLACADENDKFLEFLEDNAVDSDESFQLRALNANDSFFELTKRVSEDVIKMNMDGVKTFRAAVLIPYKLAAVIMGFGKGKSLPSTGTFYVGGVEMIDFYVNPDVESEDIFVVLSDKYDGSKSGGIYSPYQNFIQKVADPDTGEFVYFIYNRFALGVSPLHVEDNPSIMKINYVSN